MKNKVNPIGIFIVLIISVVIALIFKKRIERLIKNLKDNRAKKKEQQLLEQLGIPLSNSPSFFNALATELYQAVSWSWYNPDCDETGTQKALMQLKTDRDYNELSLAFGVRDTYNMETYIQSCLNGSEKNLVNQKWSSLGMTKRI